MSKLDHKGNPKRAADHVRLYAWFMDSPAWKALSTDARALYVLLKQQYKGNNNGRLVLSVRGAAEALHISKTTAAKTFAELIAHGFVEVVIRGSFGGRKDGRATEYRLTEHHCDVSGELAAKRFMHWQPNKKLAVRGEGQSVRAVGLPVSQGGPPGPYSPKAVPHGGL